MVLSAAQRLRILRALPPRIGVPLNAFWTDVRRWVRFRRADVCLVSYPKTGRTWLRMLIGSALVEHFGIERGSPLELEDLADLDRRIPRMLVTHDGVGSQSRPEELRRDQARYARKRVILLVRDPRDTVVSRYFHATRREGLRATLGEFIRDPRGGYETILEFHRIWQRSLGIPKGVLVVRYEDLASDAESELRRVLVFLGFPEISESTVREAVRRGAFESMRRLEAADALGSARLSAVDPGDADSFKVRRGKVGGYLDYVGEDDRRFLDERLAAARLERFGYAGASASVR